MADHITDEMVETLAMVIAGNVTPAQMRANPAEARRTRREARLALAAVAPLIRAQAFKEAAMVTSSVLESQGIEDGEAVEILNICADEIRALMTETTDV